MCHCFRLSPHSLRLTHHLKMGADVVRLSATWTFVFLSTALQCLWMASGPLPPSANTGPPPVTVELTGATKGGKVSVNATVSFGCKMHGFPRPVFEMWVKDGGSRIAASSDSPRRISFDAQNRLWISRLRKSDSGRYTCKANVEGRGVSGSILLTVQDGPTISSKVYTANESTDVTLKCEGRDLFIVVWKFKGEEVVTKPPYELRGDNDEFLHISDVRREYGGNYECSAVDNTYPVPSFANQTLVVEYMDPPLFDAKWGKNRTVKEGENVYITCTAAGFPEPEFTWKREGREGSAGSRFSVKTRKTSSTLVIFKVTRNDTGKLTCFARNKFGTISVSTRLLLKSDGSSPKCLFHFSRKNTLEETKGATVEIHCFDYTKTGKCAWNLVKWRKNGQPLSLTTQNVNITKGFLTIFNASAKDEGNFSCHVHMDSGHFIHSISLRIANPTRSPDTKIPDTTSPDTTSPDTETPLWVVIVTLLFGFACLSVFVMALRIKCKRDDA